ncbi:MAG: DUF362 domain-containing protein [Verrucomicrobia bacterium]|nr:DUF362 domain-containing protein [Verrucomicrobiota bacterium]
MNKVGIVRATDDVADAVRRAIDLVGGIGRFVPPGAKVLIKPNLCIDKDWRSGATTNPAVVEALVRLVRQAGAGNIVIADGTTVGLSTERVFHATGYDELARRCRVRLVDLNEDETERIDIREPESLRNIQVAREVLSSDVIINVPLLKTHVHTTVSVSLKNMKGVISPRTKRKAHLVGLEGGIVDINRHVPVHLIVVDGIIGHEGLGPQSGDAKPMNLILAGVRPATVDAVATRIMGFDPHEIRHIATAARRGLGEIDVDKIEILGTRLEDVQTAFRSPFEALAGGHYEGVNILCRDACSDCIGGLMVALRRMDEDGSLDLLRKRFEYLNLSLGQNADFSNRNGGLEQWVCIGRCQRAKRDGKVYVPGCPPPGFVIRDVLRNIIGLESLFHSEDFLVQEEHIMRLEAQEHVCAAAGTDETETG